jgi:hypothetical protein
MSERSLQRDLELVKFDAELGNVLQSATCMRPATLLESMGAIPVVLEQLGNS